MTSSLPPPSLGQLVYLQSVQANIHIYAVVTDGTTPNLNSITIDVSADEASALVPGLMGQTGPAGQPQFALDIQPDIFDSPAELPTSDLTEEDFGKYWLIEQTDDNGNVVSAAAYVWWGAYYRVIPFGTQGPIGPYPVITPSVVLIDPDEISYVENTGPVGNPSWRFYLAVPPGRQGPVSTLAGCVDVNETTPPTIGQVLGFNGLYNEGLPVWQPMTVGAMNPLPYIVPESAFTGFSGISSTRQTVCTFQIPPNPWPWKPIVFGQVEVFGLQLSLNPLLVDVEVLLGDPSSGTLVATGYGNAFGGAVTIAPQTSSGSNNTSSNTAMTPQNSTALVPANHTGSQGTLYVNLVNSGMAAVYDYSPSNSQLFVMCVPIGTEGAVNAGIYGSLSTKITLTAWEVVMGSAPGS
jgi:hypothetical protein